MSERLRVALGLVIATNLKISCQLSEINLFPKVSPPADSDLWRRNPLLRWSSTFRDLVI